MKNIDWVKPYIDKLFSSNSENKAQELLNEKLQYINMPYYKYCYVCEESNRTSKTIDYNIDNFENDVLFFQSPEKFNDPFDSFLGFSQIQMIRDAIIIELKRQKRYNKYMRSAVTSFFDEKVINTISMDSMLQDDAEDSIREILNHAIPMFSKNIGLEEEEMKCIISCLNSILELDNGRELFMKFISNKLTIKDKKLIIDCFYDDKQFREYSINQLGDKQKEYLLDLSKHDVKIKIETNPNAFLDDMGVNQFPIVNFFDIILNNGTVNSTSPLFSDIKKSLKTVTSTTMQKKQTHYC